MLPPAPARFSTTTCWPSNSPSAGATMRPTVSVPPPGSKPTTVVIGFAGKFCAAAPSATPIRASAAKHRFMCTSSSLAPFEDGLSLFQEGPAALDVILAREALLRPRLAGRGIVGAALSDLADDALGGAHGKRRVRRDHFAIRAHRRLELGHGHHLVHEAHGERLGGAELARGEHDLERGALADDVDQLLHRAR